MARLPRLILPGHPHHVLLRGNNRQDIVLTDVDRQQLQQILGEVARQHGVAIHAFVLMDDHLSLLVTPSTADGLSRTMQSLGRRYVGGFNARHGRSGTLWEGRFRASLIEGSRHFLECMRYIELHPVRAGLSTGPAEWSWSSAGHHLGLVRDALITEHEMYWSLGNTPFEREHAYREFIGQGASAGKEAQFLEALMRGRPLGSEAFLKLLAVDHPEVVIKRARGRPKKARVVAE